MSFTLEGEQEPATPNWKQLTAAAQDAIAGYLSALADTREMLDSRYDDIKSGRVKLIPGDEVEAYFREKSAAARRSQSGA